jgi:hypothetical protein
VAFYHNQDIDIHSLFGVSEITIEGDRNSKYNHFQI